MELKPFGVMVSVCYPPDTDTPGYKEGNFNYLSHFDIWMCFLTAESEHPTIDVFSHANFSIP
jgi:hypothetical protein